MAYFGSFGIRNLFVITKIATYDRRQSTSHFFEYVNFTPRFKYLRIPMYRELYYVSEIKIEKTAVMN